MWCRNIVRLKVKGLLGLFVLAMAAIAALVAFIIIVLVALTAVASVAAALVAYLKRETWTQPAYRWARDKTGQYRFTPWGGGEGGQAAGPAVAGEDAS